MNTHPSRFPLFLLLGWLLAGWPTTPLYAAAAVILDNTSNLTAGLNTPGTTTSLATNNRGVTFTMGSTGYTLTSVTFGVYGNGSGIANVGLNLYSGNAASGTPLQTVAPASQSITTLVLGGTQVAFAGLNWTLNAGTQYTVAVIYQAGGTQTPRLALSTVSPPTTEGLTFDRFTDFISASTNNYYVQLVGNVQSTTPDAPTGLSATPGDAQAVIAFTAPASDGGAPITNYDYSTDNGTNWTARFPSATTSPVTITGLTNGTTYQVKLRAVNSAGAGTASAAVSVTPATTGPTVTSIVLAALDAISMYFDVTFSEAVTGVDASDFTLTRTGTVNGGTITNVTGGPVTYGVEVEKASLSGTGTIRLDLKATGTGITSTPGGTAIMGGYTGATPYEVDTDAPTAPTVTGPNDGAYKAGQ